MNRRSLIVPNSPCLKSSENGSDHAPIVVM
jgi:hypothetical protein